MSFNRKAAWLTSSSILLSALATSALGQTGEAQPILYAQFTDEVIVTGQKIDRSVQDTQASVEVITALDIREENILNITDAIERTANVTTRDGSNFTIRGINSTSVSGAGQGNLATIYLDGIALPRQALFGAPTEIWDITQIEILRGPQSTLQGRASLAGAIVINTAEPTYDYTGRARAIYTTNENRYSIAGAIGGPIFKDQMAFRIAAEKSESEGFNNNPVLGLDANPLDTESIRGKLLIEPADIPGLTINLTASTAKSEDGEAFVRLDVPDPGDARTVPLNTRTRYKTKIDALTGIVDYEINDRLSLTSISGYNQVDYSFIFDVNRDPNADEELIRENIVETLQQELRATYVDDRFELIFGGFYSDEDTPVSIDEGDRGLDLDRDLGLGFLLQQQFGLDAATAGFVVSQYPNPSFITTRSELTQEIKTWALYNDSTFYLNDQITLYGGFRYDEEKQSNTSRQEVTIASVFPDPASFTLPLNQIIAGVNGFIQAEAANASSPLTEFESPTFGGFLPKAGIRYQFDDDRSLSFTAQRGYRSGGTAINAARSSAFEFDQEFTWNYELALRSEWFDRDLTLNANLFYIDWTDQQVRVQLSNNVFDTEIQNAGSSIVKGFEIEAYYDGIENLDLYGSIGFSDTKFEQFVVFRNNVAVDFSGNDFGAAPEWTLNLGGTWRPTENWVANVNANYADAAFIRSDDFQLTRGIDPQTLVNFRLGWENDNFGIYLAGNNVFNHEYIVSSFPNVSGATDLASAVAPTPDFAQFGDPRTFSLQLETRF